MEVKMEFKVVYLIPLTLFILGISLLMNLPLWIALIPIILMVLAVIYKFLRASHYGSLKGKLGGAYKLRSKINIKKTVLLMIVLVLALMYLGWDSYHTETYTFPKNDSLTNYFSIDSGNENVRADAACGCLIFSGPAKFTLKGTENMHVSQVIITPAEGSDELAGVHIIMGQMDASYYKGKSSNSHADPEATYRIGVITPGGVFYPATGNEVSDDNILVRPIVLQRGSVFTSNYYFLAGTSILDWIILSQARESDEKGNGPISIEVKESKNIKIKEIAVKEGLLLRIKELAAGRI